MKTRIMKAVEVEAKVLSINVKCSDRFNAALLDQNNELIKEHEGYVPDLMPGDHYGDYIILEIDIDTGKILNWEKPTQDKIDNFLDGTE